MIKYEIKMGPLDQWLPAQPWVSPGPSKIRQAILTHNQCSEPLVSLGGSWLYRGDSISESLENTFEL